MIRVLKGLGWLAFGAVVAIFVFMLTASAFGWHFDIIPTGSMKPIYNPGGMVISRPVNPAEIKVGDPIIFKDASSGAFICHRVVAIKQAGGQLLFQTKGDNNKAADANLVSSAQLAGKAIFYIPRIGNLAYFTRLNETPVALFGRHLSYATIITTSLCLLVILFESSNILKWLSNPHMMQYRERLKQRDELRAKRRRRFGAA
jgi:signal peptidase I